MVTARFTSRCAHHPECRPVPRVRNQLSRRRHLRWAGQVEQQAVPVVVCPAVDKHTAAAAVALILA